jgi:hypothetical protein
MNDEVTLPANDVHTDFPTWLAEEGATISVCNSFVVITFDGSDSEARDRFYRWGQQIGYFPRNRQRRFGDRMEIRLQLAHTPYVERDIKA